MNNFQESTWSSKFIDFIDFLQLSSLGEFIERAVKDHKFSRTGDFSKQRRSVKKKKKNHARLQKCIYSSVNIN